MSDLDTRQKTVDDDKYKPEHDQPTIDWNRQRQKKKLEERQRRIYERAVQYANRYGEEDYRTETMLMFLEIADTIQEIIELQETFQDVELFFNDAINIIDDNLKISDSLLDSQLSTNYGFFARMKQKRKIKKAEKNNRHRIQMLCYRIDSIVNSVSGMGEEMRKLTLSTRATMEKAKNRNKKRDAAGAAQTGPSNKELLDKYSKRFNSDDSKPSSDDSSSISDSNSKPSGGSSNLDSIL